MKKNTSIISENKLGIIFGLILSGLVLFLGFYFVPLLKSASEPVKVVQYLDVKRPSYDYLKSVTVYMVHLMEDINQSNANAGRATGIIVSIQNNVAYILTNHHVCESDNDNCYMSLSGDVKKSDLIKLEYVKTGDWKNGHDLELWRVDSVLLKDKTQIKGLSSIGIAERVYSVGNYLGFPYIYTEGTVAGYDPGGQLFNMPCVFGCSGSGIFNSDGLMVAVLYAGHGIPTSISVISSFDTSKVIAVDYYNVRAFLKGVIPNVE